MQADREAIALGGPGQVRVDIEEVLARVREARAHHPKQGDRLCASCAGKLEEAADNDGAHLLASLVAALRRLDPEIGVEASQMLHALQAPPLSAVFDSLLGDLARRPAKRVLVLDDYHLVGRPEVEAYIADIVQRLPEDLHLYIATRMDSGLPLARLRARAQLAEVRVEDLRFLPEEAAGLQMAALSLQGRERPPMRRCAEPWSSLSRKGSSGSSSMKESLSSTGCANCSTARRPSRHALPITPAASPRSSPAEPFPEKKGNTAEFFAGSPHLTFS